MDLRGMIYDISNEADAITDALNEFCILNAECTTEIRNKGFVLRFIVEKMEKVSGDISGLLESIGNGGDDYA